MILLTKLSTVSKQSSGKKAIIGKQQEFEERKVAIYLHPRNCRKSVLNTVVRIDLEYIVAVVCFLLGNSPASEFYMPTFRNTPFHLHRQVGVKND